MRSQSQVAQMASDIATRSFEKHAEHYSQMSGDDLVRLSGDLSQLTEVAQKALIIEIAKRGLKDSTPIPEQANLVAPPEKQRQNHVLPNWDYEKMSDDELHQLCAAHQKLHQPISDSLRRELDLRASRPATVATSAASPAIQASSFAQVSQTGAPLPVPAQSASAVAPRVTPSVPYARYVLLFLLWCLSASVGVFAFFDALARNTTAFAVEALSVSITLVFGWLGWTALKSILKNEPRNELKSRRRVRNTLVTSLIFVFLYLGLAALLGSVIGQNRAEAVQLNSDIENQKELADRITKARNAASDSIASYLAMYVGIESDLNNYSSTLLRLRQEIPLYKNKFPAQAEAMQKYSNTIEREIRRSDLLKKQIATAKQIALLNEYQQGQMWRSNMLPILEEEDALDKSK